jgi:hypothetical protein
MIIEPETDKRFKCNNIEYADRNYMLSGIRNVITYLSAEVIDEGFHEIRRNRNEEE